MFPARKCQVYNRNLGLEGMRPFHKPAGHRDDGLIEVCTNCTQAQALLNEVISWFGRR